MGMFKDEDFCKRAIKEAGFGWGPTLHGLMPGRVGTVTEHPITAYPQYKGMLTMRVTSGEIAYWPSAALEPGFHFMPEVKDLPDLFKQKLTPTVHKIVLMALMTICLQSFVTYSVMVY